MEKIKVWFRNLKSFHHRVMILRRRLMIDWIRINDELPEKDKMCLVFTKDCLVTQAYYSGTSFHIPWGDEYPESKQPIWWAKLNGPNV